MKMNYPTQRKKAVRGTHEVTCKRCGNTNSVNFFRQNREKFCSSKCWYEWRKENRVKSLCRHCRMPFVHVGGRGIFCSNRCRIDHSRKDVTCSECSKTFTTKKSSGRKFCSFKCAAIVSRENIPDQSCKNCGKIFRPFTKAREMLFCCHACAHSFNRGKNNALYRGNRLHDRGPDWQEKARETRLRDNNICQGCRRRPNQRASVDHIVPYRLARDICKVLVMFNPNDLINLICLCRSCHSKKTAAEMKLLRGNIVGFISAAKVIIPLERILKALCLYGLYTP